jgi:hypothetical protein
MRITSENANRPVCTIRAELRSFSVRICPKDFPLLLRREGGDDLFEPRIATQRIPEGV